MLCCLNVGSKWWWSVLTSFTYQFWNEGVIEMSFFRIFLWEGEKRGWISPGEVRMLLVLQCFYNKYHALVTGILINKVICLKRAAHFRDWLNTKHLLPPLPPCNYRHNLIPLNHQLLKSLNCRGPSIMSHSREQNKIKLTQCTCSLSVLMASLPPSNPILNNHSNFKNTLWTCSFNNLLTLSHVTTASSPFLHIPSASCLSDFMSMSLQQILVK